MDAAKIKQAISATWSLLRNWLSSLSGLLEVASKLAIPIGAMIVAYVGHSIQQSMATTQMLVQREQADVEIRAQMFKATSDQLFKSTPLSPSDQVVFAELLALNFHEHIEMKPLLLDVEARLFAQHAALQERLVGKLRNAQAPSAKLRAETNQLNDSLRELRSVARRVRSRQTAMLVGVRDSQGKWTKKQDLKESSISYVKVSTEFDENRGTLRYVGVRRKSVCGRSDDSLDGCAVQPDEGKNVCTEELLREMSPDGKSFVSLSVAEKTSDFRRQRFDVGFKDHQALSEGRADKSKRADAVAAPNSAPTGATMVNFQVTWFDFPLTDNTLLSTGARFAIFIDRICKKNPDAEEADAVRLGLLWFPRDYYPARERPTNYRQFREKLGLVMQSAK